MKKNNKVVIFGPFVGEFGWELLFWQGWVRKICSKNEFRNFHKVAISFPGRFPFYPYVDEFRSLPTNILELNISSRNYITDGWRDGFPGKAISYETNIFKMVKDLSTLRRPQKKINEEPWQGPSVEIHVAEYIEKLKKEYSSADVLKIFSPTRINEFDGLRFGFNCDSEPRYFYKPENIFPIPFEEQNLEKILYSNISVEITNKSSKKIISIFPRQRTFRREDKNWDEAKYLDVIDYLIEQGYLVAIHGEPNGAYFSDLKRDNLLNLINLDSEYRLNTQIYVLNHSLLAFGAMSGATLMSLATGCPTIIFGYSSEKRRYEKENYLKTPLVYLPTINPSVCLVKESITDFINARKIHDGF